MRNIRHINIEIDKQDFIKKLGIKDVDIEDIVNKVVDKIPKTDPIDVDNIVSKVIELLPKPKKSVKSKDINVDDIVTKVLLSIKIPEPKIIETIQKVDVTIPELVEKINTVDKEIDWKVLKNIPYDVLNNKGGKDHAIHRGGMSRFTQLTDVPQSYTGQSGNALRVKTDLTGLEFYTPAGDTDEKVKVSSNDTTAGYLNGKLVAGSGITFTENNDGGNETLTVAFDNTGGYITGATDSTLTETGDTLGLNLGNSNTWSVMQGFDDGTGNAAYLANTGGSVGGSFTGVGIAGTFSTSDNTYSVSLASNSDFAAGYFSDNFNSKSVTLANASYSVDGIGVINTDSDYYIAGSPIGVSHWSNDAGYLTSAVTSLTGTANQVLVNGGSGTPTTGAITLTLPQSIATTSTPQFTRLGVGVAASATVQHKITMLATGNRGLEINGIASQTGDYLTVLNSAGTKQFWVASTGAFGFGSGALAGMLNANLGPYLDVSFGGSPGTIIMGAENNNVTRANLTNKVGRFIGAPYNTSHVGTALLTYDSTASANVLYWGGGTSVGQAATSQLFYTASAINTPTGTQRMAMFGSGRIAMGDSLVQAYTARLAVIHTDTTTDSTLELRAMAAQTGSLLILRNSAGTALSAFDASGYLSVGESTLNTNSPRAFAQSVYYNPTSISDNSATFKSLTAITNTSAMNTYSWSGIWSRVQKSGAGTNEAIYGIGGQIETLSGSGTLAQSKALYYVMQYDSNVTDSRGIDIYSSINTGSTVGTHYGLYLRNMLGSGTCTTQYGIYIENMAKGGTNYSIYSAGGKNYFAGEVEIDGALNHDGTTVGFYGVTPVVRSATYTASNVTTDRSYDANATTVDELADVLGSLIADLKLTGIIG